MQDEDKLNLFLLYFVALALYLFLKIDSIAAFLVQASLPAALAIYILTNPAYLLVIVGIVSWKRDRIMRAFLAGVLIVLAFDIVGLPHLSCTNFAPTSITELTSIDALAAIAAIKAGISCKTFSIMYYLVLPFVLTAISIKLLGFRGFWQKIRGGG
ncbi:MAG: hypothetical protein HY376_02950 [Candidatus Blackburnbacteria bacterium]|nr:hypothetical protein [Candidatus Blackburnbacteria bacterium]